MGRGSKLLVPLLGVIALAPAAPAAGSPASDAKLGRSMAGMMRSAGSYSGAYVVNATDGDTVLRYRHTTARVLASNTKLFTTSAALARFGVDGTLGTEVRGVGTLDEEGVYHGNLFLRGGGDPTFGSSRFTRRAYGGGATVESLAAKLEAIGVERVTGRVYGDESRFDSLRGGPDSGFGTSIWVGPLSALAYNRGLKTESGNGFQRSPARFAAARLDTALERRGVSVVRRYSAKPAPASAEVLASVDSPPMSRLVRLTNKPSDNFFAEMLSKDLSMSRYGRGTTTRGAGVAVSFARRLGARARLVDGSGLSHSNVASPYAVVKLLLGMQARDEFQPFEDSLSIAGRDGTLVSRMRHDAARGRCHAKTGTLTGVSALSGYCNARSGDVYVFSILMNSGTLTGSHSIQDRMANAIAATR
jgi:D-alanyl-D-alanine carboxypeptidase/D-alanyl-D-alanine-endopeptidase (penicillin-binding protein 4)